MAAKAKTGGICANRFIEPIIGGAETNSVPHPASALGWQATALRVDASAIHEVVEALTIPHIGRIEP
jgi:hypothetical protein